ncbi:MAG: hypothetical protein Q9160_002778 [Pyrenula sp. 1 TL-2023]
MPKIVSYTPPWLSRPSLGSSIFLNASLGASSDILKRPSFTDSSNGSKSQHHHGPRRLLAKRGQEIFTVVGNQIRWSNLLLEQNRWEARRLGSEKALSPPTSESSYRVLVVPVYHQIRQLVISPSGAFLAILTQHTVHIACLPDPIHLQSGDSAPIKLRAYQLGPTTHVIPQSPVRAALWHPLSVSSSTEDCFVTITADAAVRVWELDRNQRWTFDEPALAFDLRKLIDGTSCDEDFRPLGFNKRTGFSADFVYMEVASACFGGQGEEDEDGWASMTLWVVMRTGDVYALCPILPSKWAPSRTTIPSLSTSVVSKMADIGASPSASEDQKAAQQQFQWVQELDSTDPIVASSSNVDFEGEESLETRSRPLNPSAIPRLQGPFQIDAEDDEFGARELEATDIYIMAPKVSREDFDFDEIEQEQSAQGLPATVVCLVTSDRQLLVCLNLEGVQGQWLPKTEKVAFTIPTSDPQDLILVETHSLTGTRPSAEEIPDPEWPVITAEYFSRYNFYVTSSDTVHYISLLAWATRLDKELDFDAFDEGLAFRVELACRDQVAVLDLLLTAEAGSSPFPACESLYHDDLGYIVITFTSNQPHALILDLPHTHPDSCTHSPALRAITNGEAIHDNPQPVDLPPARPAYQPPQAFYASPVASLNLLRSRIPARYRHTLTSEIRLSPSTLEIFSLAHRILSKETNSLELCAAQLFRRVDRLREELKEQIIQMVNVSEKMQAIVRDGEEMREEKGTHDERMDNVRDKQLQLTRRWDALRRKLGKAEVQGRQGRDLSTKERAWVDEVDALARNFGVDKETDGARPGRENGDQDANGGGGGPSSQETTLGLNFRYATLLDLSTTLLPEARTIISHSLAKDGSPQIDSPLGKQKQTLASSSPSLSRSNSAAGAAVTSRLAKARVADAMAMVEREGAVIEAAMKRLERLRVEMR